MFFDRIHDPQISNQIDAAGNVTYGIKAYMALS